MSDKSVSLSSDVSGGSPKKLNLITAAFLAVGTIIGSGILGTLPTAVSLAGNKTWICILVAALNTLCSTLCTTILAGVIPVNAGSYVYMTRMVHPAMTIFQLMGKLLNLFLIALMGLIFAGYWDTLTGLSNGNYIGMLVILIFGVLNLFGIDAAAKVGNILVILLFISFLLYSFYGFTVDTSTLPNYVPEASRPLTFGMIGMVSGLFITTMGGGGIVGDVAESIENPGKNIVLSFLLALAMVVAIYTIMAFATARAAGQQEFDTLSSLAKLIMPTGPFILFMVGGAMCAILSTINGLIIQNVYYLDRFAIDQVLPSVFNKTNKHGVHTLNVIVSVVGPLFILLFNLSIFTMLAVSSVLIIITALVSLVAPMLVQKRYPKAYAKAYVHPPFWVMALLVAIAAILNIYSGVSTVMETAGPIWLIMLGMLILFTIYYYARSAYLKKKGIDLNAILREEPAHWAELNS